MSSIKLTADSNGGTFELKAPSSSSNTRVLTLPDTADGTVLTTTSPKAGNIIQVVSVTKNDAASISSNASFVDIPGFTATITPSSASNKILVLMTFFTDGSTNAFTRLMRGSTAISIGTGASGNQLNVSSNTSRAKFDSNECMPASISILDSPSTTSATTYKLQGYTYTSGTFYFNRSENMGNNNYSVFTSSSMHLMEVAV